ncbi:MAG: hypothetical protein HC773_16440 [Scytonema sp. CRU_2_7]|nr:hypothetical protein [Scytonema sp. CRU_2_7]
MTFDWLEYLHLAKKLAGEATTSAHQEAQLRVTIHLAYYAAFNLAKSTCRTKKDILFLQRVMLTDILVSNFCLILIQCINQ